MIVYKITNIINNKVYIGQTIQKLEARWKKHCGKHNGCLAISSAIKKYGKENFIIQQLDTAETMDQLNEKEIYWIAFYNSTNNKIGYNLTFGGKNAKRTEETCKRIGDSKRGIKPSEETRKKLREARACRVFSEETKKKISDSKIGKKRSPEYCKKMLDKKYRHSNEIKTKMSQIALEKSIYSKSIIVIDSNNNEFKFKNVESAAIALNLKKYSIGCVLSGNRKTLYGFKFKYNTEVYNE